MVKPPSKISAADREAGLWAASEEYMSGIIGIDELKKRQRTYAPELFKDAKKTSLHNFLGEVAALLKGNS